ncbi:peptidase S8/S53 domain-containing protein [Leucosporidium creatinivorum]|uniref:Peptidase S8/S53 domain-containing protein n=1 Tax=Leucosporidium creatinivorum TaxID=106004 RepID=A0A1Y2FJI4_9BASI|nr:peptidase S8/S53 domain-containing protein [Leucosporidium creatinivorum]
MQLLLPLLLLAASASAFNQGGTSKTELKVVPNSFFVQTSGTALTKRGLNPVTAILSDIKSKGIDYTLRQQFQSLPAAFHGASITVPDGTTADDLLAIDGVQAVWPVQFLRKPVVPLAGDEPASDSTNSALQSNPSIKTTASSLLTNPDTRNISVFRRDLNDVLERRATIPPSSYTGDVFGPHVQTSVDKAHNSGLLGKGVKIGILDEGVDYTNPLLGGCFGSGCQISFGYDFVGDNYTGENTPIADTDPYSTCSDHGTFISGVIGAVPNVYGFTGVAPAATIGMYRITSCPGVTTEDVLVKALLQAANDGCNVISISLGGGVGWLAVTPAQIVIDYLVGQGVHVIVATGNDGVEGPFFAEAPASTVNGTSVNAAELTYLPTYQANLLNRDPIAYMSPKPLNAPGAYNIYFTSTDSSITNDACSPLPSSTPDLSTRAVVVQRGTCTFDTKYANVVAAGGKVVLMYNTDDYMLPQLNVGSSGLQAVGGLTREAGLQLLAYYAVNSRSLRISFPSGPLSPAGPTALTGTADKTKGGLMSSFSGYGPTNELYGQPSYTAPGANILSTVSLASGGVGIMRGTSFAAPFGAGATALILSARSSENLSPLEVRSLLTTTASWVPVTVGSSTYETVILQGGGMINVSKAIAAKTLISPYQFFLNDTKYLNSLQKLTITNRNSVSMKYTFNSTAAQAIGTYDGSASSDVLVSTDPTAVSAASVGAKVTFSTSYLTIPAGQSKTMQVGFAPPYLTTADIARFPIYSGFVGVVGTPSTGGAATEAYSVPYFGVAANMIDMPILDTTDVALGPRYPFLAVGEDILTGTGSYARDGNLVIYFRLAGGTRRLYLDLVNANIDFTGTVPSVTNGRRVRMARRSASASPAPSPEMAASAFESWSHLEARANPVKFSDVPTIGSIYSTGLAARDYLLNFDGGFTDYELPFDGTYTTSTGGSAQASTGVSYRVLLRALKITGNPTNEDQYESWLSPPFSFTS